MADLAQVTSTIHTQTQISLTNICWSIVRMRKTTFSATDVLSASPWGLVGAQRSQATCAALLMYREGVTGTQAIERLKKTKSDAFYPRVHFWRSIMRWQTWLKTHPPSQARPRSL